MNLEESSKNKKPNEKEMKTDSKPKDKSENEQPELNILSTFQLYNEEASSIFKDNICNTLELNFGFKKINYPNKIFTKKISYNNNKEIEIIQNEETEFTIKDKILKFLFDNNFNVFVKDEKDKILEEIKSEKSNKTIEININGIKLNISPYKEIEISGIYKMKNFSFNLFDENEVSIIYSNIDNKEDINYKYCIIEAKLNPKKVNNLIGKIKKDINLLNILDKKPAIILGFINSDNIKDKNHFNSLKNKKCVIYGIKNSFLCGKNITRPIDWNCERKIIKLSQKVEEIYNYIKSIKKEEKEKNKEIEEEEEEIEEKEEEEDKNKKEEIDTTKNKEKEVQKKKDKKEQKENESIKEINKKKEKELILLKKKKKKEISKMKDN